MHAGSTEYWQLRVKTMSEPLIKKKMQKAGIDRTAAEVAFKKWVQDKTFIHIHAFNTLTRLECKTIVAFLHGQVGRFKRHTSTAS